MPDPEFLAGETLPAGKLAALVPDPTPFVPTWSNVTLGTLGGTTGVWWRVGRLVEVAAQFTLGAGGDVTNAIEMQLPVPPDPQFIDLLVGSAFAQQTPSNRYAGVVIASPTSLSRFVSQGTNIGWGATQPFDWGNGSILRVQARYIAAPGA
jgi:hypothetical protein